MSPSSSFPDEWIEKVKLKLNFVDYDGSITIPDDVVRQHLQTAQTLIDSVFDVSKATDYAMVLYEECVTEYAKYLIMVSWAANAIDIEKTPNTWNTILKNELKVLRSLLLRLIGDEIAVDQILGEEDRFGSLSFSVVKGSYNLLAKYFTTKPPSVK